MKALRRSLTDRIFTGVCGGLGEYFGLSSTFFRVLFIIFGCIYLPLAVLIYLLFTLFIPDESLAEAEGRRQRKEWAEQAKDDQVPKFRDFGDNKPREVEHLDKEGKGDE